MTRPAGFLSVMQARASAADELDFFPTPPWATRAFVEHVLYGALYPGRDVEAVPVLDPCCGEGHMIETLREAFPYASGADVFDYGRGYPVLDALEPGRFRDACWVITNPPFNAAVDIVESALDAGVALVAVLCRAAWAEGADRYARLFRDRGPSVIAPYVERVPMVRGRYDPKASTATAYAWFVWSEAHPRRRPETVFIPPCRARFERPEDARRWCAAEPAPLFDPGAF